MKNSIRLLMISVLSAFSMPALGMDPNKALADRALVSAAAATSAPVIMQLNFEEGTLSGLGVNWVPVGERRTLLERIFDRTVSAAKYSAVATTSWSLGRQFQLARCAGWKALYNHEDSWPMYLLNIGRDVLSSAKEGVQSLGTAAYTGAKASIRGLGAAAYGAVVPPVKALYVNHPKACLVAGTVVTALGVMYAAKRVARLLPQAKTGDVQVNRGQSVPAVWAAQAAALSCAAPVETGLAGVESTETANKGIVPPPVPPREDIAESQERLEDAVQPLDQDRPVTLTVGGSR